jgi:hypothetical protein
VKGLLVNVYSNPLTRKCALRGASAICDTLTVVNLGKGCDVFDVTPDRPAYELERGPLNSVRLVPVNRPAGMLGMMGGSYASGDSRFNEAVEKLLGHRFYGAVPIHDRFETQEEYDALSR